MSEYIIPVFDLRPITDSEKVETVINVIHEFKTYPWLRAGRINLRSLDNHSFPGVWQLGAYYNNVTDQEHDAAWAFRFEVIGVELESVNYGQSRIRAWLRPDGAEEFRLQPGYKVRTWPCTSCRGKSKHLMGNGYVPDQNPVLFREIQPMRLEIYTGAK